MRARVYVCKYACKHVYCMYNVRGVGEELVVLLQVFVYVCMYVSEGVCARACMCVNIHVSMYTVCTMYVGLEKQVAVLLHVFVYVCV